MSNQHLSVNISDFGAELLSIKDKDGTEYLWKRDAAFWGHSAPILFPYVARLTNETYTAGGKTYQMPIHGFASTKYFVAKQIDTETMEFVLASDEETLKQYPFSFLFVVNYHLNENAVQIKFRVKNTGFSRMYFGIGGHPGFSIPLEDGLQFSDYMLCFAQPCFPKRIEFTDTCFRTGESTPYPLINNVQLPLHHSLFNDDAIVLENTSKRVVLCANGGHKSVEILFPDMMYLGIWHTPKTEAGFVCIEPWASLPSHEGIIEAFEEQPDLIGLDFGHTYENKWEIRINNG